MLPLKWDVLCLLLPEAMLISMGIGELPYPLTPEAGAQWWYEQQRAGPNPPQLLLAVVWALKGWPCSSLATAELSSVDGFWCGCRERLMLPCEAGH